ncbi:hypothetical protein ABAC460_07265 [Asticcacaulis sp. AC460]|uniref:hypothetical protein n=1 Tax=Asticcacaulis sp. AC460 TaxID=1282360 RepID=UPI0003C3E544|nr:hypothetical protein [Asticcacaulis sp. AC460]ESQ91359.1 hypothetical protein ABAC460_07265 [Asticcacaulis sp. AC460]
MLVRIGMSLLTLAALLAAGPATADEKVVKVSAQARPWDTRINRKYGFGSGDGRAPAVAFGISLKVNRTLTVTATGSTTTARGGPPFGPGGQSDYITGALPGNSGSYFPSRYIVSDNPVCLNQLVGAFVDADGVIIGEPFAIGKQATLDVPKTAVALSMGLNDDIFSDNSGELIVTISYKTPTVTAEDPTE